jgi:hypothetical protein
MCDLVGNLNGKMKSFFSSTFLLNTWNINGRKVTIVDLWIVGSDNGAFF